MSSEITRITFPMESPDLWFDQLAKEGVGEKIGEKFVLNSLFGLGELEYFIFQDGFWAQQMDFNLKKPLRLSILEQKSNHLFNINFYLSNSQVSHQVGEKIFEFNFDSVSVILISSSAASFLEFPANDQIKLFQVGFTKEWLMDNVFGERSPELKSYFSKEEPIYFSEGMDFKFKYLIEELDIKTSSRLQLFSGCLQLLNHFFEKLELRDLKASKPTNVHPDDFDRLKKLQGKLDMDPLEDISVEEMADLVTMSLSKFKRLFNQVFGVTPHKYLFKNKMEVARQMLSEKKYSISETGYLIGYSNLSQFSKAFKGEFGVLPSEI
ncbi:helix-turn-helix domain-containing protein [Algoriphagus zhangzhouensis]|uniref:AraC-type DNA-binding protein n=1 Tax=Algoriphagus zhangzhouensis TaxID=1073327 RepID=A0A1M7Z799_9BACT|nr:AraC family transcriptional regulator [Algoriphagus zhangzhouensis]TDY49355.1 AraC-like DNA-binding protein [Algoriphagus zhangzhouensis]SHO60817.1 AraC-type DNA-binding protein [Algoriphagus zhangzhouensis]